MEFCRPLAPMKDVPEASNFYLAVGILKPKSAKRNNFKVCLTDSAPGGNSRWKNLAPETSAHVGRYHKMI